MSITIGGIVCERAKQHPKEHFMNCFSAGSTVEDMLICDYEDRMSVLKALLGYGDSGEPTCPMKYDGGGSDFKTLYVIGCGPIEPIGVDKSNINSPIKAMIPVLYGRLEIDQDENGIWTEISVESCSEFLTLSIGEEDSENRLKWSDGTLLSGTEAPAKVIRMQDIVITKHNVKVIPAWAWELPGKINPSNLYIKALGKSFPKYTLLCGNPSFSRTIGLYGTSQRWTFTIRLTHREEDWNKFPRPAGGGGDVSFEYVYSNGVIQKFYEEYSFLGLGLSS